MRIPLKFTCYLLGLGCVQTPAPKEEPLISVSEPGDTAIVPGWHLQSTTQTSLNLTSLSKAGADTSTWYRVSARGTVMAGLIENGVFNDATLFYSDNMQKIDGLYSQDFKFPWLYREEFMVKTEPRTYFTITTHGISSNANIYVNGAPIASSEQRGAYADHSYNVTDVLQTGSNCILIQAYPTNYLRDFAQGFVDWNPYPPEYGTGVWRHVELSKTGAVSMSPMRILTDFRPDEEGPVNVTIRTKLVNHAPEIVDAAVHGTITAPNGDQVANFSQPVKLSSGEKKALSIRVVIKNPQIWWPARWGPQALYSVRAITVIGNDELLSDKISPRTFGIRHVSSMVNEHNDTTFSINGHRFQVLGAGYSPDMFLRFDTKRVLNIFRYMLDMGLNTVRLEGKQEHPELYDLADKLGLMILAGWECCDKWEAWEYNQDANGEKWSENDYWTAQAAMLHEAQMMQPHPSMLGFLLGSDYWPNDRATKIFMDALKEMDWRNPVIASASMRGYPKALGPSGMKMNGPYDWVPPNYWYGEEEGAAFGFGSELGAGVGTPEMGSLKLFLSADDMQALWTEPDAGLYHMSNRGSSFHDRSIYNKALFSRYGKPSNLDDYILKCQMADYEATRAQFEAYSAKQNASQTATGLIYWMLNSAWPNLHWQLFDYYLSPMGAYYGTKVGTLFEHVAYDYQTKSVWLINHSLDMEGERQITVDLIDADGKKISNTKINTNTTPSMSKLIQNVNGIDKIKEVAFLRLSLKDKKGKHTFSRNVYWLSPKPDVLNWSGSNWYYTPVTDYADFTKLQNLKPAKVKVTVNPFKGQNKASWSTAQIQLENKSKSPAVFIRLNAIRRDGVEIAPVYWSDNYVTLWPGEKLSLSVALEGPLKWNFVDVSGRNIKAQTVKMWK